MENNSRQTPVVLTFLCIPEIYSYKSKYDTFTVQWVIRLLIVPSLILLLGRSSPYQLFIAGTYVGICMRSCAPSILLQLAVR
jgi:hypothetical protein